MSIKKIITIVLCLLIFIPLCFIAYTFFHITKETSTRIQRGAIDRIIASESPVYFDDGKTPIGVFFKKTHRKYIHYNEIPKVFIKALIAAEDGNFFNHSGVDPKSIIRAFIANIKRQQVVQGGSTITQQTAKNIFRRERRSLKSKFKELVQAFLLEREYSKEEILEMYINQFFVTGYGKGLGIAAQCFFNKDAKDLDLVEAAFIAGSVKGPNAYNPFIKKTDAERTRAKQRAKIRKNYVLKNMLKQNFITRNQYLQAEKLDVPFNEGKITYRLNVILDYIREQLETDYFRSILEEQGIDNAVASGIRIYTSIDKEIQGAALSSLRTNLPIMDVKLNGYSDHQMPARYRDLFKKNQKKARSNLPFLAKITQIDSSSDNYRIVVAWRHGGGIINYDGIAPMAEAWLKWKQGNAAILNKKHVNSFLKNFHAGDTVPVQLLPSTNKSGKTRLVLSRIPELEGGIVVLQNGMIKAMVGGFLDRFFNRAVDAKRQLGSTFKTIVYTAAMQLNWNALEPLRNERDIFRFENTHYLPNPDHKPKSSKVSMVWAGAKSENLATVWLLFHLTDHLNMKEFRQVMKIVGLDKYDNETNLEYKKRIRDKHGVIVNVAAMKEAAFEKARKETVSDIIFGGRSEILNNLNRLHFDLDNKKFNPANSDERRIMRFSFKRLLAINMKMKNLYKGIFKIIEHYQDDNIQDTKKYLSGYLDHFYMVGPKEKPDKIIFTEAPESLSGMRLRPITREWLLNNTEHFKSKKINIDGLFDSAILDLIQENTKAKYMTLFTYKRYDPEVLFWIRDFRTLVNLSYVVYLSKQLGISTKLDPVLSFPLGPNAISISEAALAYQTIMTGQVFPIAPEAGLSMIPIIKRIIDRDGDILWEYKQEPARILSSRVSGLVTEILGKVMETGTGKKAKNAVRMFGIPIPSFGKTGTSNRYTNSSFVGFIPGIDKDSGRLNLKKGYVISSYVGYDDNRPMKSKNIAIYGSSGALPLWIDTADAIVNTSDYKQNIQPADLAFDPVSDLLSEYGEFQTIFVSSVSGLPVTPDDAIPPSQRIEMLADGVIRGNVLELKRYFEPTIGGIE